MDSFKRCSVEINDWINKQPYVSCKSLTASLFRRLSEETESFIYKHTQQEDGSAENLPWEVFVFTAPGDIRIRHGHKFLIMPLKLPSVEGEAFEFCFSGAPRFIETAKRLNAYPMYLIYSNLAPKEKAQLAAAPKVIGDILSVTKKQPDGCFLFPASEASRLSAINHTPQDIVNSSFNLSLVDVLCDLPLRGAYRFLAEFNIKIASRDSAGFKNGIYGFEHISSAFPPYINELFSSRQKNNYAIISHGEIAGIAAIDLTMRNNLKYKNVKADEWRIYDRDITFGYD